MSDSVCVIPAYNVESTLGAVAAGVRAALGTITIVAVDDGSSDGTRLVAERTCDRVIGFPHNRGKGAALRAGFAAALALGARAILTIDADGQHEPSRAASLLDALATADIVVGVRARDRGMPLHRRMSNALSSRAISACAGCPLPDTQSGYRAMRRSVVHEVRPAGDRYEFETEFLILAGQAGYRIAAVPVPTIYGAPSHFRELRDSARVMRSIWRHRAGAAH